jgi:hypothetical protein
MSDQTEPEEVEPVPASTPTSRPGNLWVKGTSGNPAGRRKEEGPLRDLARRYTVRAIRRLAQLMKSRNEKVAAFACTALLDRGWGRPPQAITGPDGGPLGLVVGMVAGAPITDAVTAAATYLQIMRGDPNADLSGITFEPPVAAPPIDEPPLPVMEATQEHVEAEALPPYQPPAAPALEPEAAPDESNVVNLWARLGK